MFETEEKGSFLKKLVINLLYMVLFLFLFMWLYPAPKVDLSDVKVSVNKGDFDPLFAGIYNDNITSMRDAARNYYTIDKLPKNVGDKTSMNLSEMLSKKMLVPFVDENSNSCDTNKSYVEVTKTNKEEYSMKVYLHCSDKQDYIMDTIGCTSVCIGCTTDTEKVVTNAVTQIKGVSKVSTGSSNGYKTGSSGSTVYYTPSGGTSSSTTNNYYYYYYGDTNSNNTTNNNTTTNNNNSNNNGGNSGNNDNDTVDCNKYPNHPDCEVDNDKTEYQYYLDEDKWTPNYNWTTTKKSGSDVKIYDTKTETEYSNTTRSFTFRTVSWLRGSDAYHSYSLYLNKIPSDATNVRLSTNKFGYGSDLNAYLTNRYSCHIQMTGHGCPSPSDDAIIQSSEAYSTPVLNNGNFGYSVSQARKSNGKWTVDVNVTNTGYNGYDSTQYQAPIKMVASWTERSYTTVKYYQYKYLTTNTTYKWSTNKNDQSLLNQGYRLTGKTR